MSQTGANEQSFIFKPELDAFIAQALCPKLTDSHYLQELQVRHKLTDTRCLTRSPPPAQYGARLRSVKAGCDSPCRSPARL